MQLRYVLPCYQVHRDKGVVSALAIFHRISIPKPPYTHPALTFLLGLDLEPSDVEAPATMDLRLLDPDGTTVSELKGVVEVGDEQKDFAIMDQGFALQNVRFTQFGWHELRVIINGKEANVTRIDVVEHKV